MVNKQNTQCWHINAHSAGRGTRGSEEDGRALSGLSAMQRSASTSRWATRRSAFGALLLTVALTLLWQPASAHVRAASLLVRVSDAEARGWLADVANHPVVVSEVNEESVPGGSRARLYLPADVTHPPGVVVVHGVHWKGIDEPRLGAFARAIAGTGVAVLTPEIRELCDYRIDPASIETIGESARMLSTRLGGQRVGLMGLSFAGGLSLVAASDPRYADALAFVVSLGAHDDLGRVLRFFVTDEAPRPDGSTLHIHAHDYGTVVLEYSHADDFFPPQDVEPARAALRSVLHEDLETARELAKALSPASREKMGHILAHDTASLAPELLAEIARLEPRFAAVSPAAHLSHLRVPALVLHGASDTLIPPSEAEWLAHDVPAPMLREALVSRAIEHVGLENDTGLGDRLALVHFMSDVLEAADEPAGTRSAGAQLRGDVAPFDVDPGRAAGPRAQGDLQ
jgi:dienelactone hydrolase